VGLVEVAGGGAPGARSVPARAPGRVGWMWSSAGEQERVNRAAASSSSHLALLPTSRPAAPCYMLPGSCCAQRGPPVSGPHPFSCSSSSFLVRRRLSCAHRRKAGAHAQPRSPRAILTSPFEALAMLGAQGRAGPPASFASLLLRALALSVLPSTFDSSSLRLVSASFPSRCERPSRPSLVRPSPSRLSDLPLPLALSPPALLDRSQLANSGQHDQVLVLPLPTRSSPYPLCRAPLSPACPSRPAPHRRQCELPPATGLVSSAKRPRALVLDCDASRASWCARPRCLAAFRVERTSENAASSSRPPRTAWRSAPPSSSGSKGRREREAALGSTEDEAARSRRSTSESARASHLALSSVRAQALRRALSHPSRSRSSALSPLDAFESSIVASQMRSARRPIATTEPGSALSLALSTASSSLR